MNYKKIGLLLLSVLLVFGLTGCGSNEGEEQGTVFNYAIGGEPGNLDPATGSDSVTGFITNQIWLPIYNIGSSGELLPAFATHHEVSDDGLVYTLHFRDDAYWSDGEQIVAEHVEYAMKRSLAYGTADSYYSYYIGDYVAGAKEYFTNSSKIADMTDLGVKVVDDFTLEITLVKPVTYFPTLLTAGVFTPVREDFAPEDDFLWSDTVGYPTSAAFTPISIDRSSEVKMVKNEYFYDKDKVTIDNMNAVIMGDQNAQLVGFQTEEIDMATSVDSTVTQVYKDQPELIISDAVITYYMRLNAANNTVNPELANYNVRRALQLGIDRDNIIKALNAGDAYYPLHGFIPEGIQGVSGDFRLEQDAKEKLVYTDKDEAIALLKGEGYTKENPLKVEYYFNENSMHTTIAQVIQAELKEINVDLQLKTSDFQVQLESIDNATYSSARSAMSADYLDPTTFLSQALLQNQTVHSWGDQKYNDLYDEAEHILDPVERLKKLHEVENYIVKEAAYMVPIMGYSSIYLLDANVEGVIFNPQGNCIYWYVKYNN